MASADTETVTPAPTPSVEPAPVEETPVTTDSGSTVVVVDTTPVAAQVPGPQPAVIESVPVNVTSVTTDRVILDTSSPEAVQVPPVTGDEALTPIAKAYADGKTANDKIAEEEAAG